MLDDSTTHGFLDDILADVHYAPPVTEGDIPEIECDVAPKELPDGHVMHGYRILHTLGMGGFGLTYLAEEKALARQVVLKENFPSSYCHRQSGTLDVVVTNPELSSDIFNWAHNNFMREARLLASLDHPYIARVYAFFEAHGTSYYATEYVDGKSLADVAADYAAHGMPIPQEALLGVLVRLLDAMDYLHARELLHRDIKPDNILINHRGMPVLIDFGAAREDHGDVESGVVESVGFSPAEQSKADGNMGPWTDLYALGATFYYILTGSCLPEGRQRELYDMADTLAEQEKLLKVYDVRLLKSIDRSIRPQISDRYQSAAEWLADLRID